MTDLKVKTFNKSWKVFQMSLVGPRPKGFKEWCWFLWGFDIWIENVPFLKVMVLLNILVWLIF